MIRKYSASFVCLLLVLTAPFATAENAKIILPPPQLQLGGLASPAAPTAVKIPVINGLNPSGCYDKGTVFNLLGKDFGTAQANRDAALRGPGLFVSLPVVAWGDTRIRLRLPDDPQLQPGQLYSVGILSVNGQWLSKLDNSLQICAAVPPPAAQPPAPETGNETPAVGLSGDTVVSPGGRNSGGSLLGQSLPPPPDPMSFDQPSGDDGRSEPDELLVVSPDLPQAEQVRQWGAGLGLGIKRRSVLSGLGLVVSVFRVPQGSVPRDLLRQLRTQAPDLWIDLNHRLTLQGQESERYAASLVRWPLAATGCGRGVRVGLVDGALPTHHPVLSDALIERRSFLTLGVPAAPANHALAVVAILAGSEEMGLIPSAHLYLAEVMRQRDEKHMDTTVDRLVQGLDWLVQQRVDLGNLSLGGPRNLILEAAVQRVLDLGIPLVAAAGNNGPSAAPVYPAAIPGVIAVTAIDADRRLYPEANRGDYIAFAAPGVDIYVPREQAFVYVSGTSFAAPVVTALLAQARQRRPAVSWSQLMQVLADAAIDLGPPGRDAMFGYGLPQAQGACRVP